MNEKNPLQSGLTEDDLKLEIIKTPSGVRDFVFRKQLSDGRPFVVNPLELLPLDRTCDYIERIREEDEPRAMNLALCRLLAPNVKTRGVGRHLVGDPWSIEAIAGDTLATRKPSDLASEYSDDQRRHYRMVQAGKLNPNESIEQLYWEAFTELPFLGQSFDDPALGRFSKKLYLYLVGEGHGRREIANWSDVTARVIEAYRDNFNCLELDVDRQASRSLFRKYMAVAIRWNSKVCGEIARGIVEDRMGSSLRLNQAEEALFALRHGAPPCFGKINYGFMFGCGNLFSEFFNGLVNSIVASGMTEEQASGFNELYGFVWLQRNYRRLEKSLRVEEKQRNRDRKAIGTPAEYFEANIPDDQAFEPCEIVGAEEEAQLLQEVVIPELERRNSQQAQILKAFVDHMNFQAAADDLEMSLDCCKRALRRTVIPAAKSIVNRLRSN